MTTPYRIVPALAEALEPTTDGADVTIRSVTLTPEEIEEILRLMAYERLRTMSPDHVGTLAHMMLTGQFGPGSQITFAIDSPGVPSWSMGSSASRPPWPPAGRACGACAASGRRISPQAKSTQ